jgi:hypothetical protein
MSRQQIASETARALASANLKTLPAVMGFDGFVDDIIHVVDKRHTHDNWDRLATISEFGKKISAAAGESANFELLTLQQKLGGNGPIMGNAMACIGFPVTYIGTVGDFAFGLGGAVHAVFQDFARRATLIPLASAAHTNALEFTDGKVMLGNLAPCAEVNWPRLLETLGAGNGPQVGLQKLRSLFDSAAFLGMLNWTMLPHATDVWQKIGTEILPHISQKPRRAFVDLADPQKRTAADIKAALDTLLMLNSRIQITLGLNLSEALQVARVLGIAPPTDAEADIQNLAVQIRAKLPIDTVVIHPRKGAAAVNAQGRAEFAGPFVQHPKISTGAGDHFNAGFAAGQLIGLDLQKALCLGTATSGYYVRNAESPTAAQLAAFLENLPPPQ